MTAVIIIDGNEKFVDERCSVEKAFRSLDMLPDSYLFLLKGRPIPMTRILGDGDVVTAVRIASGG